MTINVNAIRINTVSAVSGFTTLDVYVGVTYTLLFGIINWLFSENQHMGNDSENQVEADFL